MYTVQANLPKTSPWLVYPNGFVEHFFQMFIVLGMYTFECENLIRAFKKDNTQGIVAFYLHTIYLGSVQYRELHLILTQCVDKDGVFS